MGTIRKLGDILQALTPLGEQGKVKGFFTNVKNADILSGLVGDIHNAVMNYQVCDWSKVVALTTNIHFRLPYSKASMTRVVSLL